MLSLDAIVAEVKARGLKVTPQRLEILRILSEAAEPLTAQEVLRAVQATQPQVSLDTIYRNLALLVEQGLIGQVNLQNRESARYELQSGGHHHHHMVCLGCGRTFCIELCPTALMACRPDEDPKFKVVGHAFEIYGYCSQCQVQPD